MSEAQGYKQVKDFLSFNKKNFSKGYVFNEEFYIQYYVGENLNFQGNEIVNFHVQHPEFRQDVQIPNLDESIYHTAFSPKFQDYYFDQDRNVLIITQNNTKNKFAKPYKVFIYG
ncbi:hypothetical protein [uncultured Sulfuricurvum sp.]|mgnify:FL=1|uniref:hypothetical protein n=1 Tax=uncultured Sulfuricurvum sp. TaxID=430693 RepID=UPI00260AE74A|nr:hypothetical protein [uncultured Sulfuricurvum sp.]